MRNLNVTGSRGFALPQLIILIVVLGGLSASYFWYQSSGGGSEITACSMEAKICPDGSTVGRTGPNCTFPACPGAEDGAMMDSDSGAVTDAPSMSQDEMKDAMSDSTAVPHWEGELLSGTPHASPLIIFNQNDYERALADGKLVVLYFYANWCPICKAEFPRMQEAFHELADSRVVGFRVNYKDDETDVDEVALARKFGVAYQHTKIFVQDGEMLKKSPESYASKEAYFSAIDEVLTLL